MSKKIILIFSFFTLILANNVFANEIGGSIDGAGVVIGVPASSVMPDSYNKAQNIELTASGADRIHYTLDNSAPSCDSNIIYKNSIILNSSATIKALSCYGESVSSEIVEFNYVINISHSIGGSYVNTIKKVESKGEVLGASTFTSEISCNPYLTEYIVFGRNNNRTNVKKLQEFLNREVNANLPITGFYGPLTRASVNKFQLKYHDFVLGLDYVGGGTGNVYSMTIKQINKIECLKVSTSTKSII